MRLSPTIVTAAIALAASPLAAQTVAATAAEPVAAAPAAAPPAPTKAEIVCRRTQVTGSLVQWTKACHTRAQWENIDGQHNKMARQIVDEGTSRMTVGN